MIDQRILLIIGIVVLVTGIIAPGILADARRTEKRMKQRISNRLIKQGATNIVVTRHWIRDDRTGQFYGVDFTNHLGQRRQITCKVSTWTGEIYWSEPLEV